MRMNKWIMTALCGCILFAGGCAKDKEENPETLVETQALEEGDYGATLPFQSSDSRKQHAIFSRSLVDSLNIGNGLLKYSKEHFSPKSYTIEEGQFLGYYELSNLLGRESNDSDGLNPASGSSFETGNGAVSAPVLVQDIYEVDFLKSQEVAGISLAIVFNTSVGDNGTTTNVKKVKDEVLQAFAEEVSRKVVTYMRKMPEIGDTMPIFVTLYKNSTTDETLPGAFFSKAYFEGRSSSFTAIDEQWVLFPSDAATKLDGNIATQFLQVKNSLNGFLPDDVNIIGKGKFENGKLTELKIQVDMYAKTATEALSLTQYVKAQLATFSSQEYKIQVEVTCQDEIIATMVRAAGSSSVNVNTLL